MIAGSGKELLVGGAGNNVMVAGSGDDTMVSGTGHDTFVFNGGKGTDVVMNFHDGDLLQIQHGINGLAIAKPQDLLPYIHDDAAGNAVLKLGGETITLVGIKSEDMHNNPTGYFSVH
jgi:Ca2+-binding RTX toxin-like protein